MMAAETNEELIQKYRQTGEQRFRDRLVLENIGLVFHAYRKFTWAHIPSDDVRSIGSEALLKSVDGFTLGEYRKFSSCAHAIISREFRDLVTQRFFSTSIGKSKTPFKAMVLIPRHGRKLVQDGKSAEDAFLESCEHFGVNPETVLEIWEMANAPMATEVQEWHLVGESEIDDSEKNGGILAECLEAVLTKRECDVIRRSILADETYQSIAIDYGLSAERIR
jgi:RNA polymerase sigma factor (sigma-70 family)